MKHPMFATSTEDLEGHPLVEAIRALKEDDKTPVELAIMYKDEGNEWMKKSTPKDWREAYKRYSQALVHVNNEKTVSKKILILKSQILSNRSLVSLYLRNYGDCRRDADEVYGLYESFLIISVI